MDDFHDIHEKRRPDTTSLSTVKHFASCVSKKIEYPPILAINNGVPVQQIWSFQLKKSGFWQGIILS